MTSNMMRAIDQTIGPALCRLISMAYRLFSFRRERWGGPARNVRRILFVKPAEMGSTVLTYPALRRTRELWPASEIFFLVFAETRGAVDLLPDVPASNVFEIRSDTLLHFLFDSVRQIFRLRRMEIDVAVDLEFYSRGAAILTALVGARYTAGFERYTMEGLYKGNMLTHPVQYNCHIHTAAGFRMLIEALAVEAKQTPLVKVKVPPKESLVLPHFCPSHLEQNTLWKNIQDANSRVKSTDRLVILNANASDLMPLRKWPLENYVALARLLIGISDVFIVLTGVDSETGDAAFVCDAVGRDRCVNMAGKTTLRSLVTLYTLSALMVTNDSGPSHFASLTDMPAITLFGPETPEIYGPLGAFKVAIASDLACSPCVSSYNHRHSPCNDNVCMKSITVERVWQACQALLADAKNRTITNLVSSSEFMGEFGFRELEGAVKNGGAS